MQGGAALPKHGGKKRAGAEPTRPAGEGGRDQRFSLRVSKDAEHVRLNLDEPSHTGGLINTN